MGGKKIYTDKEGKEFILKEGLIKDGDRDHKVFVGMEPVLNPQGKQVMDPIMHFEYLDNKDLTVDKIADAPYPFLVFGSEFTGTEVQSLPTPFTNNLKYMQDIIGSTPDMQDPTTMKVLGLDDIISKAIDNNNIDLIANTLYDQCIMAINQNILALYNNNLRIILTNYLFNKIRDEDKLNMMLTRQDGKVYPYRISEGTGFSIIAPVPTVLVGHRPDETKITIRNQSEMMLLGLQLINTINYNISNLYYELINRVVNANIVDLTQIAADKLGNGVNASYYYSSGVDILNEIANMECGILSNVVEINVMNMVFQFNDIMTKLGYINEDGTSPYYYIPKK